MGVTFQGGFCRGLSGTDPQGFEFTTETRRARSGDGGRDSFESPRSRRARRDSVEPQMDGDWRGGRTAGGSSVRGRGDVGAVSGRGRCGGGGTWGDGGVTKGSLWGRVLAVGYVGLACESVEKDGEIRVGVGRVGDESRRTVCGALVVGDGAVGLGEAVRQWQKRRPLFRFRTLITL